ncbi:MAG: YggS family pyridoxal phosphate-dependent enzyme [Abitibacteriaceae bacterium]|nr:YggS family pyridoxal phosphate-dependent enzyme [Abditibacteriaceae bacterium]
MDAASDILYGLRTRIAAACDRVGRESSEVSLVGAAKTVPPERLKPFLEAGLSEVGENYVQEGIAKRAALNDTKCVKQVRWHLIGALQSNKAKDAVHYFDLIHSVDRLSLATALDKAARAQQKVQEVLLQVNLGDEASKAGCALEDLPTLVQQCAALPNIAVRGLMCLPPYHEDAEQMRPYFRQLREARDVLLTEPKDVFKSGVVHLSMGMSHDFEVAVEEGATLVRIGTALFGAR